MDNNLVEDTGNALKSQYVTTLSVDPLGDGVSTVEYIDHMGNDYAVVRAARVSFANDDKPFYPEKDSKLIKYLADHDHGTPFEHTAITFHVSAPIFVVRQWHRHRIGFSYNEMSRRYTSEDIKFFDPPHWRAQDSKNRQGSLGNVDSDTDQKATWHYRNSAITAIETYNWMISRGISREEARMVLPQSLYTRMYVTGNLRSFAHFYRLRADKHAQEEIRVYAEAMGQILEELYPICWRALKEAQSSS